jgi:hypothetical protein
MSAAVFRSLGLADAVVEDLGKNAKLAAKLMEVVEGAGKAGGCDAAMGNLLYAVATRVKEAVARFRPLLGKHIGNGNMRTSMQVRVAGGGHRRGAVRGSMAEIPE